MMRPGEHVLSESGLGDLDALSRALSEACDRLPVAEGPNAVARTLAQLMPRLTFRETLVRGGWYRLGGIIDGTGHRIADDIEHWVVEALARHDHDLAALAAHYAGAQLVATRLVGKTHYWIARTGTGPADFLQIEIEEMQEVACHRLFVENELPASFDELVDPRAGCAARGVALGTAFYRLRRVTDIATFLAAMRTQRAEPQSIHRFLDAWEKSSASHACDFGHHWVFALREHLDRYRQPIKSATPVAAINGALPRFAAERDARGLTLATALQAFDRSIGYPLAWFFHMIATQSVPHAVAAVVVEDTLEGFGYLPDRDVAVVRDWLHRPYTF